MFKRFIKSFVPYRPYSQSKTILHILKSPQVGQEVSVQGWIRSLRKQKELTFLDLNDGSTANNLQIVFNKKLDSHFTVGASVSTAGVLRQTPKGQTEVSAENIILLGECDLTKGYPFAPRKEYEPEYVRDYLHFRPRTRTFSSLLRLRHATYLAIHNYLDRNGYFNIHTPIITSNDCEGAGEIFKVIPDNEALLKLMAKPKQELDSAYFNRKAYLTVSGQLHLETAAQALDRVYCFGPTFRAENSKSRFHLSEFYMLEVEKAFLSDLNELLKIVEDLVKTVTAEIMENHLEEVKILNGGESMTKHSWLEKDFVKITYKEALDILTNKLNKPSGKGINKESELVLTEYFKGPVFVINWPKEEKPFYMKTIENNVAAFDLLAPNVGEIVGGSLREDNYEKLQSRVLETVHLNWYLDLRKFGYVPTGGFGLGFERFIQFLLGIENIKDTIPFPRWPHNCRL